MNTLEAVRDAQQMWGRKFQNAGRERIVLNGRKRGVLSGMLGHIFNGVAKPMVSRGAVSVSAQKRHAMA